MSAQKLTCCLLRNPDMRVKLAHGTNLECMVTKHTALFLCTNDLRLILHSKLKVKLSFWWTSQTVKRCPTQAQKKLFQSLHCCVSYYNCGHFSLSLGGFRLPPTSPISSSSEVDCIMQIQTVTVPA